PDGKYLFAEDKEKLIRYEIDGLKLTLKARSAETTGSGRKAGICVSSDSRWVCFPTGSGNGRTNYATYIYRTDDLSKPAFLMKQGPYPEVVGFDPPRNRFFSQNSGHYLLIFNDRGVRLGAHRASDHVVYAVQQYAARPTDGRALLIRTIEEL